MTFTRITFSFPAHLPKPSEFSPKNTPGTIKPLMSTLVPSRTLFVPWTPSSNTLLHKHADKVHPQKQIFKGQAKQEPFHAHKIQNVFSTKKNARTYFLCTQTATESRRSGVRMLCACTHRCKFTHNHSESREEEEKGWQQQGGRCSQTRGRLTASQS